MSVINFEVGRLPNLEVFFMGKIVTLPQGQASQPKSTKKKKKSSGSASLNFWSEPRTVQLKFYVEQLMDPAKRAYYTGLLSSIDAGKSTALEEASAKQLENETCRQFWDLISTFNYLDFRIAGIYHNQDLKEDKGSSFVPSIKKGHWHVMAWKSDFKNPTKRFRLSTLVKKLGLQYSFADETLWKEDGAEQLKYGVPNFFMYLTHESADAIRKAKHVYDRALIAKNFSDEEAKKIRLAYKRSVVKTALDWDYLAGEAYNLGKKVGNFSRWADLHFNVGQQANRNFKVIREKYNEGLNLGITTLTDCPRCSIVISGAPNLGKTYTSRLALKKMGLATVTVASGTGKYDRVQPETDALIFDDIGVSDARNVFDNVGVVLHRRNSDDRPFKGKYVIVTTNETHSVWTRKTAIGVQNLEGKSLEEVESLQNIIQAVESRVYFAHISDGKLVLDKRQERGSQKDFAVHDKMFLEFKKAFDTERAGYVPASETLKGGLFADNSKFSKLKADIEALSPDCFDLETLALAEVPWKNYVSTEEAANALFDRLKTDCDPDLRIMFAKEFKIYELPEETWNRFATPLREDYFLVDRKLFKKEIEK